jgi:hypothetical protein
MTISPTPNGAGLDTAKVFGGTPKTAVEMTAPPKATEAMRLLAFLTSKLIPKKNSLTMCYECSMYSLLQHEINPHL